MTDQQVPDDSLKRLRMGGYRGGIHRRDDDRRIRNARGITPVTAEYSDDPCIHVTGVLHRCYQVGTDVLRNVTAPDREHEDTIGTAQAADLEPANERAFPAFIIDARGELGDIVRWRITLDTRELAKVVDRVRTIRGAPAHAQEEQPTVRRLDVRQHDRHPLDRLHIQSMQNGGSLAQVLLSKAHWIRAHAVGSLCDR